MGKLRTGYTTGACAAAATKAACTALLKKEMVKAVEIRLPAGQKASFRVTTCIIKDGYAECSVIKDAGDDPDVTHGAEICSRVSRTDETEISIRGGEGVGRVTRPGLGLEVGSHAINPVPRQMIVEAVREVFSNGPAQSPAPTAFSEESNRGFQVVISVTGGEKIARKTLNSRLGIVGGISILGTTGIVIPYSLEAYTACITQSLQVAKAGGLKEVVLTSGRQSERFAQARLSLPETAYIQMGDNLTFALEECSRIGLEKVHLWAMMGKLSKIAAGHLSTHFTKSSIELDFLLDLARNTGATRDDMEDLKTVQTAHDFLERAKSCCHRRFFAEVCCLAAKSCREHVKGAFSVDCVLVDYSGNVLGKCRQEAIGVMGWKADN